MLTLGLREAALSIIRDRKMAYILLAEDDPTLRTGLSIALESEGYEVCACADGAEALAAYAKRKPDLIVLDIMMPVKSGYDVCMDIRRKGDTVPIIFLTAKSSEEDVVVGLGLGADEFIAKPLRIKEFLARIEVMFKWSRRLNPARSDSPADDFFMVGGAKVDTKRFVLSVEGQEDQPLTMRELGLLRELASHPGEVLSRADLLESVWGLDYAGTTRTLDQHIVQIRRKLGPLGSLIETVRGTGYRLISRV